MRWLLPLIIIFGCSHPPPPPPPTQVSLNGIADLAGKYTGGNEIDWGFFLTIEADGKLDLQIDRGKMGRCEQAGTLVAGADKQTFAITYTKNECDRDHAGQKLVFHVESFTTAELVVTIKGDGVDEKHRFAPKSPK